MRCAIQESLFRLISSAAVKNDFSFMIETEEPELPEAIEFLGAERFLFATDYPAAECRKTIRVAGG
jgi:hypothetical protein